MELPLTARFYCTREVKWRGCTGAIQIPPFPGQKILPLELSLHQHRVGLGEALCGSLRTPAPRPGREQSRPKSQWKQQNVSESTGELELKQKLKNQAPKAQQFSLSFKVQNQGSMRLRRPACVTARPLFREGWPPQWQSLRDYQEDMEFPQAGDLIAGDTHEKEWVYLSHRIVQKWQKGNSCSAYWVAALKASHVFSDRILITTLSDSCN